MEGIFKEPIHNHGAFEAGRHRNTCPRCTYLHYYSLGNLHSNPNNSWSDTYSNPDRRDTNSNPDRTDTNFHPDRTDTNSYTY